MELVVNIRWLEEQEEGGFRLAFTENNLGRVLGELPDLEKGKHRNMHLNIHRKKLYYSKIAVLYYGAGYLFLD